MSSSSGFEFYALNPNSSDEAMIVEKHVDFILNNYEGLGKNRQEITEYIQSCRFLCGIWHQGKLVSQLLIDSVVRMNPQSVIFGTCLECTHKDMRQRGFMRKLFEHVRSFVGTIFAPCTQVTITNTLYPWETNKLPIVERLGFSVFDKTRSYPDLEPAIVRILSVDGEPGELVLFARHQNSTQV